ncbi:hypothetical protein D3C83_101640 [compost metagenome]
MAFDTGAIGFAECEERVLHQVGSVNVSDQTLRVTKERTFEARERVSHEGSIVVTLHRKSCLEGTTERAASY